MEDNDVEQGNRGVAAFDVALTNWELSYEALDDRSRIVPALGRYPLLITTITVLDEHTTLETLYPFAASTDRCGRAMELAARFNLRLAVGAVTADPTDGTLGFRTHLPIRAGHLTVALAAESLACHWEAANRVLPGLAVVVFTDLSLNQAIAQTEGTAPLTEVVRDAARHLDAD